MKLGWLRDFTWAERPGGAQRAIELLQNAAPPDVQVVQCPPGGIDRTCDAYVAFLVKRYSDEELSWLQQQSFVRYCFDWWPDEESQSKWRNLLMQQAKGNFFVSPLHFQRMHARYHPMFEAGSIVCVLPPPLDLEYIASAKSSCASEPNGSVWFAEWHPAKGPDLAAAWAQRNQAKLDMFSPSMPADVLSQNWIFNPLCKPRGFCPEEKWYSTLAGYERFVHFNRVPDAFGYSILEAYLLGLEVVVSGQTGVESYEIGFDQLAEKCGTAASEFWRRMEEML